MLSTIHKFKHEVLKSEYIRRLAQELDINEEALLQESGKNRDSKAYSGVKDLSGKKASYNINSTERLLIKLMLDETGFIHEIKHALEPADFQEEGLSSIVSILFDLVGQGKNIEPNSLINYFGDERIRQIICESTISTDLPTENRQEVLNDCINRLKSQRVKLKNSVCTMK